MAQTDDPPGRTGLAVFGVFLILLSGLSLLFAGFMGWMSVAVPSGRMPHAGAADMAGAIVTYAAIAAFFLTFGIGTLRAKRWARTIMLIVAWPWLAAGVVGFAALCFLLPRMMASLIPELSSSGALVLGMIVGMGVIFLIYIVLPGVMVLFYGNRKVAAAFGYHDPGPSWTDACPAPVLAVSLFCAAGVPLLAACMPFYRFAAPFFGTVLTGWTGGLFYLATVLLLAYVAWGFYRLDRRAWWVNLAFTAVWGASGVWTLSRLGLLRFYADAGIPPEQVEMIRKSGLLGMESFLIGWTTAFFAAYLGYLLYLRKYFAPERS